MKKNMLLYHYCSNKTFHSIVINRTIRLSSLSLSNDSMEGMLVKKIILELATADNLNQVDMDQLKYSLTILEKMTDGLGFCLSEKGDLLSQWRGYANDASGISIGFSKNYLEKLSEYYKNLDIPGFVLQKVEYEKPSQLEILKPVYDEINKFIKMGAFEIQGKRSFIDTRTLKEIEKKDEEIKNAFRSLSMTIIPLFAKLFLLKNKAFSQESEWRLLSHFLKIGKDECMFQPGHNIIIPYREFRLEELNENPIKQIFIGPKNETPEYVMDALLRQNDFSNVEVLRSEASYK